VYHGEKGQRWGGVGKKRGLGGSWEDRIENKGRKVFGLFLGGIIRTIKFYSSSLLKEIVLGKRGPKRKK